MTEPTKQQTFKFGGGDKSLLSALEAAQRFAGIHLPKDLTSTRVKVPKEKIDFGLSIQIPAYMSEDEWKAKAKEIHDVKERESFKKYWSQYEGGASEHEVWKYISRNQI